MALEHADEMHLLRAIELARLSRAKGNHPFGSLLVDASGRVVLEAENTVGTEHDVTGHAELNLVRRAGMQFDVAALQDLTLYKHRTMRDVFECDLLVGYRTRRLCARQ